MPLEELSEAIGDSLADPVRTILVVEDECNLRELTAEALRSYGYSVLTADSGESALDVMSESVQKIDLILTDVVMPGMNGRELADILLSNTPNRKILFMSGYMDDSVLRHGVNSNDVSFLQKPFTPFRLLVKVRKVLDSIN